VVIGRSFLWNLKSTFGGYLANYFWHYQFFYIKIFRLMSVSSWIVANHFCILGFRRKILCSTFKFMFLKLRTIYRILYSINWISISLVFCEVGLETLFSVSSCTWFRRQFVILIDTIISNIAETLLNLKQFYFSLHKCVFSTIFREILFLSLANAKEHFGQYFRS